MIMRRMMQLYAGLVLHGFSMALMIHSNLGLHPWDVLHQGLARQTSLSFGLVVVLTGLTVLALWIPLRERPGLGTISNVLVIGVAADVSLALLPQISSEILEFGFAVAAVVLCGIAGAAYMGAGFGLGPRDGLMMGIVRKSGWQLRWVRSSIEIGVLAVGWSMGGTVGVGTILFALTIGPMIHFFLPHFDGAAGDGRLLTPATRDASAAR